MLRGAQVSILIENAAKTKSEPYLMGVSVNCAVLPPNTGEGYNNNSTRQPNTKNETKLNQNAENQGSSHKDTRSDVSGLAQANRLAQCSVLNLKTAGNLNEH